MADLLADAVPAPDRAEAHALLLDEILPRELQGLPHHPKPRRLAETVYGDVADVLRAADGAARLQVLRARASAAVVREQAVAALALAIARYLASHPAPSPAAMRWIDPLIDAKRALGLEGIEREASRRLSELEAWESQSQAVFPDVYRAYRRDAQHARLALQSARSGSFASASGALHDFLVDAGEPVQQLDFH
jgi:hypothetical protein